MTWFLEHAADALLVVGGGLSFGLGAHTRFPPLLWAAAIVMMVCCVVALTLDPRVFRREPLDARVDRWQKWGWSE